MKPNEATNFKPVKLPNPGTTPARCYSVVDIGTVPNIFKGKLNPEYPTTKKIFITFELPAFKAIFVEGRQAEPFVVSVEFTHVYSKDSNLTKFLQSWMNRALTETERKTFDLGKKAIGKIALVSFIQKRKKKFLSEQVSVVTNENTVLVLNGILQLPGGMICPPQMNPTMVWDWSEVEASKTFDQEKFNKIPGFVRAKMIESEEYKKFAPKDPANPITDPQPEQPGQSNDFGSDNAPESSGLSESWGE
jgi:hypothetical protein